MPKIMQAMFGSLRERLVGGAPLLSRSIVCNLPEGQLASGLGALQAQYPDVDIGSYPSYAQSGFRVAVVLRHTEADVLDAAARDVLALVADLGGEAETQPI